MDKTAQGIPGEPYVILLSTLHDYGSSVMQKPTTVSWCLTSPPKIAVSVDLAEHRVASETQSVLDLQFAAFAANDGEMMRRNVSAVLLGPFGRDRKPIFGMLNPNAIHAIEPAWFRGVSFATHRPGPLRDGEELSIIWVEG